MNRLADETSPYLRQHRDNPVDWYAWGDEAFAAARDRDRPVLLSVGYSACHWCHVMAHESFEDAEVAAAMNDRFVSVKVDREERPDVDAVYMDAVQAIAGRGGWPMTVFLTPDGKPFFGGTYFPKPQFLHLLDAVANAWDDRREELLRDASSLTEAIGRATRIEPAEVVPGVDLLNAALGRVAEQFDPKWGGFGPAPKFPSTMSLELVLRAHLAMPGGSDDALRVVTTSLDAMAAGGIYDHLRGGFARYSTDERWLVPHFEKMLYDQALLARVYLHAWQVTGDERYRQVLDETIDYVLGDLTLPGGGFASAEDADAEPPGGGHPEEGRFTTWTPAEVLAVLGTDDGLAAAALAWWNITEAGHLDGRAIPHRALDTPLARPDDIEGARRRLLAARAERPRPGLDDKVLTEWNAMFCSTLAEAAAATGDDAWRAAAVANGEFLLSSLRRADGRWLRSWQAQGGARHPALAADYAALVDAFTRLAEATGEARWITEAVATADATLDLFWDPGAGGLFTTGEDAETLVVRQKDLVDSATPSANSLAAVALLRLGALTGETRYANHAERILQLVGPLAANQPGAFAHLLAAVDLRRAGITEIAVVGDRADLVAAVHRSYLPNAVLAWGEPYDSPLWEDRKDGHAYVCRNYACLAPVDSVAALETQLTA